MALSKLLTQQYMYLQTEDEGNETQYKEAKEQIDNRQDQVVVRLDPYCVSNNCWLLSYNHLERTMSDTVIDIHAIHVARLIDNILLKVTDSSLRRLSCMRDQTATTPQKLNTLTKVGHSCQCNKDDNVVKNIQEAVWTNKEIRKSSPDKSNLWERSKCIYTHLKWCTL